ncbi:MAG: AbrB/MazE/SpoVT family DNA-binding domain-containing protein, partial [Spirochaetia bacterium]
MEIPVVKIGNSRGIRIPKSVIDQLYIQDKLELEVHENEIVLKPVRGKVRE